MTRYFSLLTDVDEVEPCPVGLHHGKNAIAVTEGTINFVKGLILNNISCVPNLICNLIHVS